MYAPPDGLGPVQTYYVAAERAPDKALIATLLYAAEKGLVRLTQVERRATGRSRASPSTTRGSRSTR